MTKSKQTSLQRQHAPLKCVAPNPKRIKRQFLCMTFTQAKCSLAGYWWHLWLASCEILSAWVSLQSAVASGLHGSCLICGLSEIFGCIVVAREVPAFSFSGTKQQHRIHSHKEGLFSASETLSHHKNLIWIQVGPCHIICFERVD